MKSFFFLIWVVFGLHQLTFAQENHVNAHFLGGSLSFHHQDQAYPGSILPLGIGTGLFSNRGDETYTTGSLQPYFGTNVSDKWSAGIQLIYTTTRRTGTYTTFVITDPDNPVQQDYKSHSNRYGGGVFFRYNVVKKERYCIYLQPQLHYSFQNSREYIDQSPTLETRVNFGSLQLSNGFLYALTQRVNALVQMNWMQFLHGKWKDDDGEGSSFTSFGISASLTHLNIGVEIQL